MAKVELRLSQKGLEPLGNWRLFFVYYVRRPIPSLRLTHPRGPKKNLSSFALCVCDSRSERSEFLEHWPSLGKLQRARPATIERFFVDHNSRNPENIAKRLDQIRNATQATTDSAVITSCSAAVVAWPVY
jgi:hypothetical protein